MKNIAILNMQQFEMGDSTKEFHSNTLENHLVTSHKNISKPHKHNFYLAVLFTQGTGTHEIDFVKYDVKRGSLFFLNPGQMHHWELSDDVKGFIFFHTQSFYELHFAKQRLNHYPFFSSVQNPPHLYLNEAQCENLSLLFAQINTEKQQQQLLKSEKILACVDLIYIESTRLYIESSILDPIEQHSYSVKFQELEKLVEAHYKTEKSASKYAEWLFVSPKHLNRVVQDQVGKTTTEIILDRVVLEAKRELISKKFSFNEIAMHLGYEDYAYFSRVFKKKCGETPSSFVARYK